MSATKAAPKKPAPSVIVLDRYRLVMLLDELPMSSPGQYQREQCYRWATVQEVEDFRQRYKQEQIEKRVERIIIVMRTETDMMRLDRWMLGRIDSYWRDALQPPKQAYGLMIEDCP